MNMFYHIIPAGVRSDRPVQGRNRGNTNNENKDIDLKRNWFSRDSNN